MVTMVSVTVENVQQQIRKTVKPHGSKGDTGIIYLSKDMIGKEIIIIIPED